MDVCHRCRKKIRDGSPALVVTTQYPPPSGTVYRHGDHLMRSVIYHRRCLPPSLFHKFGLDHAGSRPVGQSPATASLPPSPVFDPSVTEHVRRGGLSRKKRKRPARRVRYKRTRERRILTLNPSYSGRQ